MNIEHGARVQVEVVGVRRRCSVGHRVGDRWEMGEKTPEGLCIYAFLAMAPAWSALRNGGTFAWEEDPDVAHFSCPDQGEVVFRLRRVCEQQAPPEQGQADD